MASDLALVDIDAGEVEPLELDLGDDLGPLAVDVEAGLAYVAVGGDDLAVVDVATRSVSARVRLREDGTDAGDVTDIVVAEGRALVLLTTAPDAEGRAESSIVTVEPAL